MVIAGRPATRKPGAATAKAHHTSGVGRPNVSITAGSQPIVLPPLFLNLPIKRSHIHILRNDFALLGVIDGVTDLTVGVGGSDLLLPVEIPLAPVAITFTILVLALYVEEILHCVPLAVLTMAFSLLDVPLPCHLSVEIPRRVFAGVRFVLTSYVK